MKKIVAIIMFLLFCSCAHASIFDSTDTLAQIGKIEGYLIYINTASIERRTSLDHEYIVVEFIYVPRGEKTKELFNDFGEEIYYLKQLRAFNPNEMQSQELSLYVYNKSEDVIDEASWDFNVSDYSELHPQSIANVARVFAPLFLQMNELNSQAQILKEFISQLEAK